MRKERSPGGYLGEARARDQAAALKSMARPPIMPTAPNRDCMQCNLCIGGVRGVGRNCRGRQPCISRCLGGRAPEMASAPRAWRIPLVQDGELGYARTSCSSFGRCQEMAVHVILLWLCDAGASKVM